MASRRPGFRLRAARSGDFGWIVSRHGALYAKEQGWDERFEAEVCRIVLQFLESGSSRKRCWIAEAGGKRLGSVYVVERTPRLAQLRVLLVEPEARGMGVGRALVARAVAFARKAGFNRIMLVTYAHLLPAGNTYRGAGFRVVKETPVRVYGQRLVDQRWELDLRAPGKSAARWTPAAR